MSLVAYTRTPLNSEVTSKDVILAGKVTKVTEKKTSKAGNEYIKVTLSSKEYDPDLEMDIEEEKTVLFLNKPEGAYGPQLNADQVEKLKVKEGSLVAIRATESINVNDQGEEEETYFGSRIQYANGTKFEFKFSKKGSDASVVCGKAVLHENDEGKTTLSVPISMWDKEKKENYTAWCNCGEVDDETKTLLTPTETYTDKQGEEKPKLKTISVSFSGHLKETLDDDTKRVKALDGVPVEDIVVVE